MKLASPSEQFRFPIYDLTSEDLVSFPPSMIGALVFFFSAGLKGTTFAKIAPKTFPFLFLSHICVKSVNRDFSSFQKREGNFDYFHRAANKSSFPGLRGGRKRLLFGEGRAVAGCFKL